METPRSGDGSGHPTIVLIHGFGASLRTWDRIVPALPKTYPLLSVDLKGFGLSGHPRDGRYSIDDNADLLIELLRERGLEHVILVGHSYGGAVALTLAARLKRRALGLVLIDAASYQQRLPFFVETMRHAVSRWFSGLMNVDRSTRLVLWSLFADTSLVDDETVERYAFPRRIDGSQYAAAQTALQIQPESFEAVTRLVQSIDVPTQIIWGERDNAVPPAFAYRLHAEIRGSRLQMLPGVGHMPHEERPAQVAEVIGNFLRDIPKVHEVHDASID